MAAAATKKAEEPEMNIYQRINAISQEAGALEKASTGGVPFPFRGIDGTINHLTPYMHKYGVFNTSKALSHLVTERESGNRVIKTTQVEVEFEFFGPDGSSVTVVAPGLADDFADRSTAQAMSVAYRIALLQLFHLPTMTVEPEVSGQAVMDGAGAAAPAKPKAVAAATTKAAGGATTTPAQALTKLQAEAKAYGLSKLGKTPDELNALGTKIADGVDDWFNNAGVMTKLVDALKAEAAEDK